LRKNPKRYAGAYTVQFPNTVEGRAAVKQIESAAKASGDGYGPINRSNFFRSALVEKSERDLVKRETAARRSERGRG